jgi:hypothetical protein
MESLLWLVPRLANQSVSTGIPKTRFSLSLGLINRSYPASHLNFISSKQINNTIDPQLSAIKDSLASLKGATDLTERIPYLSPLAGALLQALTMQNVSVRLLS